MLLTMIYSRDVAEVFIHKVQKHKSCLLASNNGEESSCVSFYSLEAQTKVIAFAT